MREFSEQPYGLVHLQKKLLSDLKNQQREQMCSIDEGIIKIKDAIDSQKVLIVFDDVYQVEQIDALVGM